MILILVYLVWISMLFLRKQARELVKEEDVKIELVFLKELQEKMPCNFSNLNMMDLFLIELK
jgi:hypothetical protein